MSEESNSSPVASGVNKLAPPFVRQKHVDYVVSLDKREKDSFEFFVTEHLRMNGLYWGITALDVLNECTKMDKQKIVDFVVQCQHENGKHKKRVRVCNA